MRDALKPTVARELGDEVREHFRSDGLRDVRDHGDNPCWRPRCRAELDPPAPPRSVSVVIATRNRSSQLATCLASVLQVDYPAFEIVVVDNAPSDDSTRETVESFSRSGRPLSYVREERPGASEARNVGARAATGEIVAFTNDDVVR